MHAKNTALIPLNVLIVGCGNIAGGFDQARAHDALPYTHAGAFSRDGRFRMAACVEPDENRRTEFMTAWQVPVGFSTIEEALNAGEEFDVISICSPTSCHVHDLELALHLQPKLIFCEKPVSTSFAQTENLVNACSKANIAMAVNYTRRWDPAIVKLQSDIETNCWGDLRSISALYNKGILNNGSHLIDLLHFLVGSLKIVSVGKPVHDFFSDDPTIPVWLESDKGIPVQIANAHAADYAVFEVQFVFSRGVLTMEEGGMIWRERRAADSGIFKGYTKLEQGINQAGGYSHAMPKAVDNIYRAISQNESLASTGYSALAAQRLCEDIKQRAGTF